MGRGRVAEELGLEGVGLVIVGRNEGDRLRYSLDSVQGLGLPFVYVDSGSSDGSSDLARAQGATIVVDLEPPYSAARARNVGFAALMEHCDGELDVIQFLDGDCELQPDWLQAAVEFLASRPQVAVVCGQVRERHPEASTYNRIAAMEWEGPTGEIRACGGNAMIRADMFEAVGGFDATLIAGEEPEMHLRMRRLGGKVWRLDHEMVLHDSAMFSLRHWWSRSVRAGHAYAEAYALHGREAEHFCRRELFSILAWGGALPLAGLALAPPTLGLSLWGVAAGYGLLFSKTYRARSEQGDSPQDTALYAANCVACKISGMQGAGEYLWNHVVRRRATLVIDHKSGSDGPPNSAG